MLTLAVCSIRCDARTPAQSTMRVFKIAIIQRYTIRWKGGTPVTYNSPSQLVIETLGIQFGSYTARSQQGFSSPTERLVLLSTTSTPYLSLMDIYGSFEFPAIP